MSVASRLRMCFALSTTTNTESPLLASLAKVNGASLTNTRPTNWLQPVCPFRLHRLSPMLAAMSAQWCFHYCTDHSAKTAPSKACLKLQIFHMLVRVFLEALSQWTKVLPNNCLPSTESLNQNTYRYTNSTSPMLLFNMQSTLSDFPYL